MTPLKLCKCLSDETRLRVVGLLKLNDELCVCDLVDALNQPQPTVSRHLAQLRSCGMLSVRRDGQWSYYRLSTSLPGWAMEVIESLMKPSRALYSELKVRPAVCCS